MALTIRKKSGLIIPKTPTLILPGHLMGGNKKPEEEIIESQIKNIIKNDIGLTGRSAIKRLKFIPIYKTFRGEKEINKLYFSYKTRGIKKVLKVDDIENTGITLIEFLDYIITNGATEIQDPRKALEIM